MPRTLPANVRLYGILDTGYAPPESWPEIARRLLDGGVGILQIRAKGCAPKDIARWASAVLPLTRHAGIPLILNDHPELVPQVGADGCHIGQDGGPLAAARARAGGGAVIGRSTHSLEQALEAEREGFDYIGFGPIFPTGTKPGRAAIGREAIPAMAAAVRIPAFCIGGIHAGNLAELAALGAQRVVVVSALLRAPDPTAYARALVQTLESAGSKTS